MNIAKELDVHASEELSHALQIAKQIDYLGGMPTATPLKVKTSDKAKDMLRFDLDNELQTIAHYRRRIRDAETLGEYALCEVLRQIAKQEQEHAIDLATALGIEVPPIPEIKQSRGLALYATGVILHDPRPCPVASGMRGRSRDETYLPGRVASLRCRTAGSARHCGQLTRLVRLWPSESQDDCRSY